MLANFQDFRRNVLERSSRPSGDRVFPEKNAKLLVGPARLICAIGLILAPSWPQIGAERGKKSPKRRVQSVAGDGSYGNGSTRQRGDRWQVRSLEDGQRQSLSGFLSAQEARDELEKVQLRLRLGAPGVTRKPKPICGRGATPGGG